MVAVSGRYIVLIGDKSDHGGTIITGDPIGSVNGIPMARTFDLHACPQSYPGGAPHGVTPIFPISCNALRATLNGRPTALSDDRTGCGAIIFVQQKLGASNC